MMQALHCTYNELRAMPAKELEVFKAFMRGEGEAQKVLQDEKP